MARRCIFCGAVLVKGKSKTNGKNRPSNEKAEEHCLPRWIQRRLGIELEHLTHTVRVTQKDPEVFLYHPHDPPPSIELAKAIRRRMKIDVHPDVCFGSNGGWMLSLEKAVENPLMALVEGRLSVSDLSLAERRALTRWMLKTAFVICASQERGAPNPIPLAHVLEVRDTTGVPPGVHLFSHCQEGGHGGYWYFNGWVGPRDWLASETQPLIYKASIRLGRLALMVAYIDPGSGWRFGTWAALHKREDIIWPKEPDVASIQYHVPVPQGVKWPMTFHISLGATSAREWRHVPAAMQLSPFGVVQLNVNDLSLIEAMHAEWRHNER